MNSKTSQIALGLLLSLAGPVTLAGPLDPECTAEKAAKSAAAKATVGVGGRCDPKEAAHDTAQDATGLGDKDKDKEKDREKDKDKDKDSIKPWASG